mmetsp:Transcript_1027/g.2096  ORF Transcript_1027/g.2096 Transcript_1027/m.2096 type:complete len:133 (-) Transcript_1027:2727-3125(-)
MRSYPSRSKVLTCVSFPEPSSKIVEYIKQIHLNQRQMLSSLDSRVVCCTGSIEPYLKTHQQKEYKLQAQSKSSFSFGGRVIFQIVFQARWWVRTRLTRGTLQGHICGFCTMRERKDWDNMKGDMLNIVGGLC